VAVAGDDSETCGASWRRVEPISLSPVRKEASPSPSQLEVTYTGGGVVKADRKAVPPLLGGVSTGVH
jgi:hypothetical protein